MKEPYTIAIRSSAKELYSGGYYSYGPWEKGPLCGNVPCPQKFLEKSPKREAFEPFGVVLRTKPSASSYFTSA